MKALTNDEAVRLHCPMTNDRCRGDGCMGWEYLDHDHRYMATVSGEEPADDRWTRVRCDVEGRDIWKRPIVHEERRGRCTFGVAERMSPGVLWPPVPLGGPVRASPQADAASDDE